MYGIWKTVLIPLLLLLLQTAAYADAPAENLHDIPSDLMVPQVTDGQPAAGLRVRQIHPDYEGWDLCHVLYLPPEWKAGGKYPVIVEYPGNGDFRNKLGDRSTGKVEDCRMGYGLSGGERFLWVCLPFVDVKNRSHALHWWGDADATAAYCRQTVAGICRDYGGDERAVILTGFSRGAIACNYIGLRDDETAKIWRAMVAHSHYDGVRRWGQPNDDQTSARKRLERFRGRPQFITHELSVDDTRKYLKDSEVQATFLALPWPNHSDAWVLKDVPARAEVRKWLDAVLKKD